MKQYPAITVKQPWASLIITGYKDVENRSWATSYRGRLWVHAGLKWDPAPLPVGGISLAEEAAPRGVILGSVDLIDIVADSNSPWARPGQWHWLLRNPVMLTDYRQHSGQVGLWWPEESTDTSSC